jgi:hypothetical protein
MQAKKPSLKIKNQSQPQDPIVLSIPLATTLSNGKPVLSSQIQQIPRILHPSKPSSVTVEDEDEDNEVEQEEVDHHDDHENEDGDEDGDAIEPEDEIEPETINITRRKQRTKKVYPPSDTMFNDLLKYLCDLRDTTRKVISLTRETQKCVNRENREFKNQLKKQKGDKPKHKPRGFALPSQISDEMVDYLTQVTRIDHIDRYAEEKLIGQIKIEYGCELARHELTSAICQYFRKNNMRKNNADHRDIFLDEITAQLFRIDPKKFAEDGGRVSPEGEPIITYFDLQKYIPIHCKKKSKVDQTLDA